MTSRLYAELHRWAAVPHEWGYADCMMVLADWVLAVRGFDAGEGLRGTYGSPDICPLGRAYRADPEPVFRRAFAPLVETDDAQPGDIGLVRLPGQRWLFGALRLDGRNWAMKTEDKPVLITKAARPHLVYSVGYAA